MSTENLAQSEDQLSSLGREFIGQYDWRDRTPESFLDLETIDLRPDGTYSAKVEATLVNPSVRSFRFPCTLEECGRWNAYKVSGQTRIRLRPSTNKGRVYAAALESGKLSLTRLGKTTVLVLTSSEPCPSSN